MAQQKHPSREPAPSSVDAALFQRDLTEENRYLLASGHSELSLQGLSWRLVPRPPSCPRSFHSLPRAAPTRSSGPWVLLLSPRKRQKIRAGN